MTYPGDEAQQPQQPTGQLEPYQQHQQPYAQPFEQPQYPQPQPYQQQPPVSGQPYGQPYGQPGPYVAAPAYGPPTGALPGALTGALTGALPGPPPAAGDQRGGKWALLGGGAFLLLIVLVVGGYFAYQKVFVHTPTEVVQAYLGEATKDKPEPAKLEQYLCKAEASKLERELSNANQTGSSAQNPILDWHVTGESISGSAATVSTTFTIKTSSSGRTATRTLNLTLIKEDRAWKICGYEG